MNFPKVKTSKAKLTIVCFAGTDWWYHNRNLFCPQIMTRLAKEYKVLFINSLGMRIPSLKRDSFAIRRFTRKLRSILRFLRKTDNGMYVFSPFSLPYFGNSVGKALNALSVLFQVKLVMILLGIEKPVFYVGCPPALEVVRKLGRKYLIYERADPFEYMPGVNRSYISSLSDELVASADLVLYVNRALWKQGMEKNKNSVLVGHGVDFSLFAEATESGYVPEDIAEIPRPIVGYFGNISDRTSDLGLLEFVAEKLPDMSLVLIGPVSANVRRLKQLENVYFLGQKPYGQISHYGKVFDVAIMPWNKNRWIEFCNPVKIKEYLALGKPIVSVDYPELKPYHDIVYVASDYVQFTDSIRRAAKECDPSLKRRRQERVRSETWDNKVQQIMDFIEKVDHNHRP